jgi:lipopolysaccharide transport system ATP-binding protein
MDDTLLRCDHVGKKFCRDLKLSLWYGLKDTLKSLPFVPQRATYENENPALRKGEFWANYDVNFEVRRGECLGLIGRNGAGKTTLLKMINGLLKPDRGQIELRGRVGALIALGAGFNPVLTGRENIYVNGAILGMSKEQIKDKLDYIVQFAEIEHAIDSPVRNYSSGMHVRLGFSIAANLIEPDVLILDEVLSVGDAGFKIKSFNRVSELMRKAAVILVTHSMQEVSRACNKVAFLRDGAIVHYGNDVGTGIEKYLDLFGNEAQSAEFSEKAQVSDIKINEQTKFPVSLEHGEDYEVSLSVKTNLDVAEYFLMIQITDKNLRIVAQYYSNNMGSSQCFRGGGTNRISIKFTKNDFTNGEYNLTVFVIDPRDSPNRQEQLAVYRNCASIKVRGLEMFIYAPFLLKANSLECTSQNETPTAGTGNL